MARVLVVGGGRMGEALAAGLVAAGWTSPEEIVVAEADAARRDELASAHPGLAVAAAPVDGLDTVLAVKPGDAPSALAGLAPTRVLSVAAGVTTAALVGAAASAVAPGAFASDADLAWAEDLLGAVGTVTRVPEHLLDAVTGLSASGPAYVFLVAEALIEAGVLVGLPRAASAALAVQTLVGSARLLAESGEGPEELRAAVTSPGGTTAAGLRALEAAAVRSAFLEAVAAATERARQLGG